jgi:hypothetical protein
MREIATIPLTTPPVMAAEFERLAPGGKCIALGEDVGVMDMLGGPRVKPGPCPGKFIKRNYGGIEEKRSNVL